MSDIVERAISPFNPATNTVQNRDKYNLFAPVASTQRVGMAGFNPTHFKVDEQIVSLNDEFSELINRMDTAENDIDNLENRVNDVESDIDDLQERMTTAENDIDNLQDKKLDKSEATGFAAYTHVGSTQTQTAVSQSASEDAIVQRISGGQITVPATPSNNTDATSRIYVDERDSALNAGKLDKSVASGFAAYTHVGSTQSQTTVSQSALSGVIVQRISGGQITVPKTPSNNTDAVSKGYADAIDNKLATEITTRADADLALSKRIEAQEGLGGFLDAHDFGTATPSQEVLTTEALNQIPSIDGDALKIWNGTRITNLYDNNVWQFNHVSTSAPPYEWANIGSAMIAQATNEILGIVKGSDSVRVNSQGEVYTSVSILGAIPSSKESEINEAVEKVNNAVSNMEATLGLAALWDAEGENELLDAEEEYLLSVAHIDANSINGREFYVMSKAEHAALIQAGTYIPDAFYLTF